MEIANRKAVKQLVPNNVFRLAPYVAAAVILIILPPFLPSHLQRLMIKILIFAIFALSYDVIFGYTGLLSLGHATYFGVGGYTTGILIVKFGIKSFWASAPLGVLTATLVAGLFGIIALRVTGMYFLLVTLALAQLVYAVALKWYGMTGGSNGFRGIPLPNLGFSGFTWEPISFYYFVFLIFVICFLFLYRLINSPFGYALKGISKSEPRMQALGYNTWLYKYIAFVIAGFFAGVAGMLFGHHYGAISIAQLSLSTSALVLLAVIIGSPGTLFGPVIGVGVILVVQHVASMFTPERWPLILGGIFVLAVMFFRGGIGVHFLRLRNKVIDKYGSAKD